MTMLQHPPHNSIDWSNVYFTAEAFQDPFDDVQIITARSQFLEHAYQIAAEMLIDSATELTEQSVSTVALSLIAAKKVAVREFVETTNDGLIVCINSPSTEDDNVMFRALDLVALALDQLDGQQGVVYFGDELQFSVTDVASLIKPIKW